MNQLAFQGLPASLIRTESGGNFAARNNVQGAGGAGHFGRGQFSRARLQDAERAGVLPAGTTPEAFLANPELQERVERWHAADIGRRIQSSGLDSHIGRQIGGVEVTPEGMLAVAHLGGFGGLRRFLETEGRYNPADAFGTSLQDYLGTHRNALAADDQLRHMGAAAPTQPQAPAPPSTQQPQMNALAQLQQAQQIMQQFGPQNNALDPEMFMSRRRF